LKSNVFDNKIADLQHTIINDHYRDDNAVLCKKCFIASDVSMKCLVCSETKYVCLHECSKEYLNEFPEKKMLEVVCKNKVFEMPFDYNDCSCPDCPLLTYVKMYEFDEDQNICKFDCYICDECILVDDIKICEFDCSCCNAIISKINSNVIPPHLSKTNTTKESMNSMNSMNSPVSLVSLVSLVSQKINLHDKKQKQQIRYLDCANVVNHKMYCWDCEYSICAHSGVCVRYPIHCIFCDNVFLDGYGSDISSPPSEYYTGDLSGDFDKCICSNCDFAEFMESPEMFTTCMFCCNDILDKNKIPTLWGCNKDCKECLKGLLDVMNNIVKTYKSRPHTCDSCEYIEYL